MRDTSFRPGAPGFDPYAPIRPRRPAAVAAVLWLCFMLTIGIAMLGLFFRLTHHQPHRPVLRPTLSHSWVPSPRSTERSFATLEIGDPR